MKNMKAILIEYWYPQNRNDADLAKALEVDHSLISKWCTGVVEPSIERKVQIAKTLGVDSRVLFPDNGNK